MAVHHTAPTCPFCGKPTAEGIYRDESNIPSFMRIIGDTFIGWTHKDCNCKEAKKARKAHAKQIKAWSKEQPFTLQELIDKKNKPK